MARQRAALIRLLKAEGLLEQNRRLPVPAVPLRIGLVASPGTEGYRDFLGQLLGSGFGFQVLAVPAVVQGPEAPASVARALRTLAGALPTLARGLPTLDGLGVDLGIVVRGGGSRGDLAAFDSEEIARAIACSPFPVWVGIGHTGDESVADLVASRSFITPTECGQSVAERVAGWWEDQVSVPATVIARRALGGLNEAEVRDRDLRHRLVGHARHQLRWHGERLAVRAERVHAGAPRAMSDATQSLMVRAARLGPLAGAQVARAAERQEGWRRLVAAYDVDRQLARGYTLTLDDEGRPVRSVAQLAAGTVVETRFVDGSARSLVESVDARPTDVRVTGGDGAGSERRVEASS